MMHLDAHRHHVRGIESERHVPQADEGADHQPGAHEKYERQRELRGDEESTRRRHAARSRGIRLEHRADVDFRGLPGRHQTEYDGAHERNADGEHSDAGIDADVLAPRQRRGRHQ